MSSKEKSSLSMKEWKAICEGRSHIDYELYWDTACDTVGVFNTKTKKIYFIKRSLFMTLWRRLKRYIKKRLRKKSWKKQYSEQPLKEEEIL